MSLRSILASEGLVASEISKQAFTFKEVEPGIYEIGSSNWAITMSPYPPFPTYQLLREQMRAGGTWEINSSAHGEDEFINGPLAKFYDFYFGEGSGQAKLQQDDRAIRTVLRKL